MELGDFFEPSETIAETHSWILLRHDSDVFRSEILAEILADSIIRLLCRGCPHHYQAWRQCMDSESSLSGASRSFISASIRRGLGLPEEHRSQNHLEGFIAEYLWYFLSLGAVFCEEVVRIEPPGFAPTDPGGDGLVIHRVSAGYLMFRLWEIKKSGSALVRDAVNVAYGQLDRKATEYLARYTAIGQELDDVELAEFYGQLIDLWVDAMPGAAAGVSVATSLDCAFSECFTTFGERFPRFVDPVRLRGMLTAIGDFSAFAENVRNFVWRAL